MAVGLWQALENSPAPHLPLESACILDFLLWPSPLHGLRAPTACCAPAPAPASDLPCLMEPMPRRTGAKPPKPPPPEPPPDPAQVERLAGMGLTLREILTVLDYAEPLDDAQRTTLQQAVARGRAKGSARIKEATFHQAEGGALSAQKHMLDLLDDGAAPRRREPVRIVRKILE